MDFATARRNMVNCQILPNQVDDERIIGALMEIPREIFVPDHLEGIAYVDESLPLGERRYVMQAMAIARLLQIASLKIEDLALSIGCGTGYAVAILANIIDTVVALESDKGLIQKTSENLAALGLNNVAVVEGKLEDGNSEQGPYDVIFFDGAIQTMPSKICDQLAEGGRLVAVLAGEGIGKGCVFKRIGGVIAKREIFDVGIPLLPGFEQNERFQF